MDLNSLRRLVADGDLKGILPVTASLVVPFQAAEVAHGQTNKRKKNSSETPEYIVRKRMKQTLKYREGKVAEAQQKVEAGVKVSGSIWVCPCFCMRMFNVFVCPILQQLSTRGRKVGSSTKYDYSGHELDISLEAGDSNHPPPLAPPTQSVQVEPSLFDNHDQYGADDWCEVNSGGVSDGVHGSGSGGVSSSGSAGAEPEHEGQHDGVDTSQTLQTSGVSACISLCFVLHLHLG